MPPLIAVAEALRLVLERARPLETERVGLDDADGRVLAGDARATAGVPPFASSAMDGFAVRSADTPGRLRVMDRAAAGVPSTLRVGPEEAIGIATGAMVPAGADAVVPIELVTETAGFIEVTQPAAAGAHVRPRGGDVGAGEVVLGAGATLASAQVGALAAAGIASVMCHRRPLVSILSTGTELREPGETLSPGQIFESNSRMLGIALQASGAIVTRLAPVEDTPDAHRTALERALDADVVVTSGGVSVGPHDLVRATAASLGAEEVFWGVAMRPGKPLSFAVHERTLVFGLPGNPVSALVGATLFVAPALRALQGSVAPGPRWQVGTLTSAARRNPHRDDFVRARVTAGRTGVELAQVAGQESHMIVRAASADAIVHVPAGEGEVPAGASARYVLLP